MKQLSTLLYACFPLLFVPAGAVAAERGSRDDAVAMVKKAVAFLKKNGRETALQAFIDPHGPFRDRDLYVIVFDLEGNGLAHINPRLIGKPTGDIRGVDGKYILHEQRKLATEKGTGWMDYKCPDPARGRIEAKSTYLEKVDDLVLMCGIYQSPR
jgi:cytochrome c